MNNYLTAKEMAEKWNMTTRSVQQLCKTGRLAHAQKFGRDWMIPEGTERPEDRRTRAFRCQGEQELSAS